LGLIFISILHHKIRPVENAVLFAIVGRLYYIPILYVALKYGFTSGTCVAMYSALAHYMTMNASHYTKVAVTIEHYVDIPFLLLI